MRRSNPVKMLAFPNVMYRFSAIPVKIPAAYSEDVNKVCFQDQKAQSRQLLQSVKSCQRLLETHCEGTTIKTVWKQ